MAGSQLTGLRFMFQRKFWGYWAQCSMVIPALALGYYWQHEHDKEAYAMRGRSKLFQRQAETLEKSGARPLWK